MVRDVVVPRVWLSQYTSKDNAGRKKFHRKNIKEQIFQYIGKYLCCDELIYVEITFWITKILKHTKEADSKKLHKKVFPCGMKY